MATVADEPPDAVVSRRPQRRRRSLGRSLLVGAALGFVLAIGVEILRVTVGPNLHVVVPGECYRSAQPSPRKLADLVRRLHIRTVVNLRGPNAGESWYDEECAAVRQLGLNKIDVRLSGYGPPEDDQMRLLIDCLDKEPGPLLLHCCSGSDRSGFAAALYLLLHTDIPFADARRQLGVRYGHNPFGGAGLMTRLLDAYDAWLTQSGQTHSRANLRHWAYHVYRYADWRSATG